MSDEKYAVLEWADESIDLDIVAKNLSKTSAEQLVAITPSNLHRDILENLDILMNDEEE